MLSFDGSQCAGNRRVDVADDHYEMGLAAREHGFERRHDGRGLLRVAARANIEVDIWRWNVQIVKKDLGELLIVVLAGVDDRRADLVAKAAQLRSDGRDFDEVRARARYQENPQRSWHAGSAQETTISRRWLVAGGRLPRRRRDRNSIVGLERWARQAGDVTQKRDSCKPCKTNTLRERRGVDVGTGIRRISDKRLAVRRLLREQTNDFMDL